MQGTSNPWRDLARGLAFLAPNLGGFLLFTALPVLAVFVVSFTRGTYTSSVGPDGTHIEAEWCGLENYRALWADLRPADPPTRLELTRTATGLEGRLVAPDERLDFGATLRPDGGFEGALVRGEPDASGLAVSITAPERVGPTKLSFTRQGPAPADGSVAGSWTAPGRREGELRQALRNTAFLLLAIPLQMALSLGLAILLDKKGAARAVLRTLLFLPTVAAGIALYMVWRQLYNQEFGLLNNTLAAVGVGARPDWLGDPSLAKPALIAMLVWIAMGGTNMILYLAGLQDIDASLYEAAAIDGAGPWDTFRHVTWPALRPTTFFILTTNLIGGIQIFDQVLIMTRGGPEGHTSTILYYIYRNIYEYQGKLGYAAAVSVFLFGLVLAITLAVWFADKRAREAS
jgi:multiple sugar transport system permease protein